MAKKRPPKKGRRTPKTVLRLPDLLQAKSAVLNSASSYNAQRGYRHALPSSLNGTARSPAIFQQDCGAPLPELYFRWNLGCHERRAAVGVDDLSLYPIGLVRAEQRHYVPMSSGRGWCSCKPSDVNFRPSLIYRSPSLVRRLLGSSSRACTGPDPCENSYERSCILSSSSIQKQ